MLDGWSFIRPEKGRDRLNVWLTSVPTVIMTQDLNWHSEVPKGLDALNSESLDSSVVVEWKGASWMECG